jgi:hypothetical protein
MSTILNQDEVDPRRHVQERCSRPQWEPSGVARMYRRYQETAWLVWSWQDFRNATTGTTLVSNSEHFVSLWLLCSSITSRVWHLQLTIDSSSPAAASSFCAMMVVGWASSSPPLTCRRSRELHPHLRTTAAVRLHVRDQDQNPKLVVFRSS